MIAHSYTAMLIVKRNSRPLWRKQDSTADEQCDTTLAENVSDISSM